MQFRLSLIYFAMFSFIGIHMPFWPVWLKSRGVDLYGIAALSALSFALKIIVTPWVSKRVDLTGKKREALILLALGLLIGCALFQFTTGFLQIFILTTMAFSCWSPIMSLAESITMMNAKAHKLDYGRIRLWGSVSFMLVVSVSGKLLALFGESILLWSIVLTAGLLFVAALALPADVVKEKTVGWAPRPPLPQTSEKSIFAAIRRIFSRDTTYKAVGESPTLHKASSKVSTSLFWRSKWFVGFLLAATLIQGSHAVYYTFSAIHWRASGMGDQTVGLLWGASLAAEVLFFAFGRKLVDQFGAINVIVLGGACASVRWLVMGATVNPAFLAVAQLLHAISFGASHFAAMRLMSERVDDALSATSQGLYSAFIMGVGMGVFVLLSGPLYTALGDKAFYLMGAVAVLGTSVMLLAKRFSFDRITPELAAVELPPANHLATSAAATMVSTSASAR